ncbi:MAG: thioredoxin fold domain-containing protein [Massilia sp.]
MFDTLCSRLKALLLAFAMAAFALPAHADLGSVRSVLAERMGAKKIPFTPSAVQETLIKGLYRWEQGPGTGVVFVNDAVTLMLATNSVVVTDWMQPVRNPQPISEAEKGELLKEMVRNIRFEKLIKIEQGTGKTKLLLVSAFDCPYCIKFERMLASAGDKVDATIYILPGTLNWRENARASTVRNIWCANDNARLWRTTLVKASQSYGNLPNGSCDLGAQQVDDLMIILQTQYGKFGFPAMVFADGSKDTAAQELPVFKQQLQQRSGNDFWAEANADKYAQFRASAAAADTPAANPLKGLFKRLGVKDKH